MKIYFLSVLLVVTTSTFSLPTRANVIWDLNNFFFEDGAQAVGQFEWDDVNHSIVAWHIEIPATDHMPRQPGYFFDPPTPGIYSNLTGTSLVAGTFLLFQDGYILADSYYFRIRMPTTPQWTSTYNYVLLDSPTAYLPVNDSFSDFEQQGQPGFMERGDGGDRWSVSLGFLSSGVTVPTYTFNIHTPPPSSVHTHEPTTLALLGLGLAGLGFSRKKSLQS